MTDERKRKLTERDHWGSRFRCLLATSQPRNRVSRFLTSLADNLAVVEERDHWAPDGFREADEARLGETADFLELADREVLSTWWLVNRNRANTPNWDIVSTCRIGDRQGLLLVEAKAHLGELSDEGCTSSNRANFKRIVKALDQASEGLNGAVGGFSLSATTHYQLSNRFAFAWKLAMMNIPVVLVYLGFIEAHDMRGRGRKLIENAEHWREWVTEQAKGVVPSAVWGSTYPIGGTAVSALIKTAVVDVDARVVS